MKIVLIGGPTSSGKTTTTDILKKMLPDVEVLIESNFYKDNSSAPPSFDDPAVFDGKLLASKLKEFRQGKKEVRLPIIERSKDDDGTRHFKRINDKEIRKPPTDLLIVEGVFALQEKQVRDLANLKVYIYADDDLRLLRKLKRCKEYKEKYGEPPSDPEDAKL